MLPSSSFHSKPSPQNVIQTSSSNHPLNEIEEPNPISEMGPNEKELRVRIFILDFVYISGKFSSGPAAIIPEMKKYLRRHPVIGVYRYYENWSTETFGKAQRSEKWNVCYLRIFNIGMVHGSKISDRSHQAA